MFWTQFLYLRNPLLTGDVTHFRSVGRLLSVQHSTRSALLLLSAITLCQCSGQKQVPATAIAVVSARTGAMQTQTLMLQAANGNSLPGASLGMYVANYMINSNGMHVQGAVNGVTTGLGILVDNAQESEESFALLEELGTVLQVTIPDMLNRSTDRQKTLDTYLDTLTTVYDRSQSEVTALKQTQTTLLAKQHDTRTVVTQIQHDLNLALQKQDYASASTKQSEIIDAKAEQSKAETEVSQLNSTMTLYTNLNKIAAKRLQAIQVNREPLIAGLTVVDVPGIEDLDVLKKGTGVGTTNGTSIFGN
jgi:hypothetical protein